MQLIDEEPTIKVTDEEPTVKVTDEEPTIKVTDEEPTIKVTDTKDHDTTATKATAEEPSIPQNITINPAEMFHCETESKMLHAQLFWISVANIYTYTYLGLH